MLWNILEIVSVTVFTLWQLQIFVPTLSIETEYFKNAACYREAIQSKLVFPEDFPVARLTVTQC